MGSKITFKAAQTFPDRSKLEEQRTRIGNAALGTAFKSSSRNVQFCINGTGHKTDVCQRFKPQIQRLAGEFK